MEQELFQQGDVLFFRVDTVPSEMSKAVPNAGRFVVARGEATGHTHSFAARDGAALWEDGEGTMWCAVDNETVVMHEEHGAITLPAGKYRVGRVREVDPFEDEIRNVVD